MKKRYLLFSFLFINFFSALAQDAFIIPQDFSTKIIGENLLVLNDKEGKLNYQDIYKSQKFIPCKNKVPNLGFTEGNFWIRFKLKNESNVDSNFIIQINQSVIDELQLFELNENGVLIKEKTLGELISFNERKYKDQYLLFDTKLNSNQEKHYLIRVKSGEQVLMPVQVGNISNTLERNRKRDLLFGIYFGVILVMMAYNLFIYFTVKDKSYLYYVVYIFFVGFTQAVLEGYALKFLWTDSFWFSSRSVYYSTTFVCLSSIEFLRFFLHTKEFTPKLDKFKKFIVALFLLCIVANTYKVNAFSHQITQAAVGIVSVYIFVTSLVIYRKGYPPAKFFFLAWIILVIGVFVFVLKDAGIIEANIFTTYALQFGSVVEVILLSFALADRINILKKEKEESQAKALEALRQNEILIKEQNILLEKKVAERTLELEKANVEINLALNNLKETQAQLVDAEKMASLGQLTAGIAHEINNPINFVSANVKPLKLDVEDILSVIKKYEELEGSKNLEKDLIAINEYKNSIDLEYVKNEVEILLSGIEDGAKRTAEIVTGLKNFSRLDETDVKQANINEGIESTLVLLKNLLTPNIKVIKELGDLPLIDCLPGKLNQVFMNLFSNALYAIKKKGLEFDQFLKIKTFESADNVILVVEDSGIGMSEQVKHKIFEPFFTTKDVGEGTGLGMSIVFKIIETHQAKIEVESKEGVGTKISIILKKDLKLHFNN
ncbi:MAG: 7TM diverse intracellular signaling domain-containing protein [Bacteroidota bacterium]|jgi:two-component system NtrC family sensor kinase